MFVVDLILLYIFQVSDLVLAYLSILSVNLILVIICFLYWPYVSLSDVVPVFHLLVFVRYHMFSFVILCHLMFSAVPAFTSYLSCVWIFDIHTHIYIYIHNHTHIYIYNLHLSIHPSIHLEVFLFIHPLVHGVLPGRRSVCWFTAWDVAKIPWPKSLARGPCRGSLAVGFLGLRKNGEFEVKPWGFPQDL